MPDVLDRLTDEDARAMERFEAQQASVRARQAQAPACADLQSVDCVECGAPVSVARQRALPHTRRCVDCAADIERRDQAVRP